MELENQQILSVSMNMKKNKSQQYRPESVAISFEDQEEDIDIYKAYTSTDLYKSWHTFFISLRFFGLHHTRMSFYRQSQQHTATVMTPTGKTKCSWENVTLSRGYAYFVAVVVTLNHLRYYFTFRGNTAFDLEFFNKIIVSLWTLLGADNVIVCLRASESYNCFPNFFLEWQKIHSSGNRNFCLKVCHKNAYAYNIVCWILVICNMAANIYLMCFTDMFESWLTPFDKTNAYVNVLHGINLFVITYLCAAWMFPSALHYLTCQLLYTEFKRFNALFRKQQLESKFEITSNFEELRQHHQCLSRLVSYADEFLALYHAGIVIFTLVSVCIHLFNLIWYTDVSNDPLILTVQLFWVMCLIVNMTFVCVGGAMVNHEVMFFTFFLCVLNM